MSSRKSREPPAPPPAPGFKNDALRQAVSKWKQEAPKKAEPPPPPKKAAPPPRPVRESARSSVSDEALFHAAMEDVRPMSRGPKLAEGESPAPHIEQVDEDAEALARLAELVATGEGIDIADTDEYAEGVARGVDQSLLLRLRRGDFSVQAHVDLHGLGTEAARDALERFLVESRRHAYRCVLVVHGRGLHSKDQIPVIKERMTAWLSRGRLARMVLAFATARPVDGGAGAMYVLLRR